MKSAICAVSTIEPHRTHLGTNELSAVASLDVLVLVVQIGLALLQSGLLGLDRARQLGELMHQLCLAPLSAPGPRAR